MMFATKGTTEKKCLADVMWVTALDVLTANSSLKTSLPLITGLNICKPKALKMILFPVNSTTMLHLKSFKQTSVAISYGIKNTLPIPPMSHLQLCKGV